MRVPIFCLLLIMLLPAAVYAQASNVYVTPGGTATGSCPAGTSSAPNLTPAGFNTPGNWGSGAGKIGPGTTVLWCGTYTGSAGAATLLTFQGSGASGNPITFNMDTGSIIQASSWAGAAINLSTFSYITFDGKGTGTIQATANGTNLANQTNGGECIGNLSGDNITVQGVTCANIYVHYCAGGSASCSDEGGQSTSCIYLNYGSNITIRANTGHDARNCFGYGTSETNSYSNITIGGPNPGDGNTCYHANICFELSDNTTGGQATSNITVAYNKFYDGYTWSDDANYNHGDGMHIFINNPTEVISGLRVYGNFIYGNWANSTVDAHVNAWIFIEGSGSGTSNYPSPAIFNNILEDDSTASHGGNGMISLSDSSSPVIAGNTINGNTDVNLFIVSNADVQDNIAINGFLCACHTSSPTTIATWDYNTYYLMNAWDGSASTFAGWQSNCSCDAHSTSGIDPNLAGPIALPIGSPSATAYEPGTSSATVIKHGQNLSALSILPLDSDYASLPRASSGTCSSIGSASCWDIGAYSSGSTGGTVLPPTSLIATVE